MKFRAFSIPTMLRKVPKGKRKGFCVLASNTEWIKSQVSTGLKFKEIGELRG